MKKTKLFLTALISMFAFTCGVKAEEVSTAEELKNCLAKDGSTCVLAKDIAVEPELIGKTSTGVEVYGAITLKDVKVTLDLNGKVLSVVKNDKMQIQKGVIGLDEKADLTINDTTGKGMITPGESTTWAAVTVYKGSKLTVNGGTLHGYSYAISGNGSKGYGDTTITINGGTLKGEGDKTGTLGIYHPQTGTLTINDGTITADLGIEIRSGELNVNGGTITGIYKPTEVKPNGNGPTTNGAGIAVAQHTTKNAITVNIKAGTIKGFTAFYESNPQKNSKDDIAKIKLNITGGTFTIINNGTNAVYSEDFTGFITGGTFSSDVTKYIVDKHIVKKVNNEFVVSPNKVLETTDEKVIFESEEAIPNDFTLKVTEKTEDEIKKGTEKVTETYKDNKKVKEVKLINLYEIEILNGDDRVENLEDGKFTIAIAIPESEQKYDAYKVVYFDEDGKLVETLDAKLENGKVVFTTTHLSTYGIIGYNNVAINNPNTSDMNLALILTILGLASVGAVLVSRKKLAKANR